MVPLRGFLRGTHGPSRYKINQAARMVELPFHKQSEQACPYHALVLQNNIARAEEAPLPIQRFLVEGPYEQYAFHVRPDNGIISTDKSCECWRVLEKDLQISEDEEDEIRNGVEHLKGSLM
jgi:hypothetical protein